MEKSTSKSYWLFVCYTLFGVSLFLIFLAPMIKINAVTTDISYSVYEFVESFSANVDSASAEVQSLLSCCYALFVFASLAVLATIYSVQKALNEKKANQSFPMLLICIVLIVISSVMIGKVNALDKILNDYIAEGIPGWNGRVTTGNGITIGGSEFNAPKEAMIQVGACPIILLVVSCVLVLMHFFYSSGITLVEKEYGAILEGEENEESKDPGKQ